MVYEKYSLDRALNQLFIAIQQFRTKPSNPLYSHLPNSITVNLADIPISMVLSPQSVETDEAWAHWGERDDLSSSDDEVSEMGWDASMKQLDLRVEPWQTLLLIDEDATEKAGEISTSMVGLGIGRRILDESEKTSPMPMSRGASRERSMEEDEGLLMRSLIGACDVSKPSVRQKQSQVEALMGRKVWWISRISCAVTLTASSFPSLAILCRTRGPFSSMSSILAFGLSSCRRR